ncbi:hypothetical protein ABPG72_011093 [Tetrahymena utriculariae]
MSTDNTSTQMTAPKEIKTAKIIEFDYAELADKGKPLYEKIKDAYGPEGVGICLVRNVPGYVEARKKLLPLAFKLANLPKENLQKLVKPEFMHAIGWSHGVEQFKGKFDFSKGSFYANPVCDMPDEISEEQKKDGAFVAPNFWPKEELPELEFAFKEMGKIVVSTGTLLSFHIDEYVHSVQPTYKQGTLESIVSESKTHLARLLHYFPSNESKVVDDDWCGWHNDHGALTGLCSAIYTDENGEVIDNFYDPQGGLFAKNRFADQQRLKIPQDCLAFQIGETSQILTGGILEATPHCVVRGPKAIGTKISRNTFACFMQPNFGYPLNVPEGMDPNGAVNREAYSVPALKNRWENGISYLKYSFNSFAAYS